MIKKLLTTVLSLFTLTAFAAQDLGTVTGAPGDEATRLTNVRYVRCGSGNDSADGLTHATAWNTLGKVNSTVNTTSTDVLLYQGTTCEDQVLFMDWPGTSANRVLVDTYYVDANGIERLWHISTGLPKAKINGTYEPSCRALTGPVGNIQGCAWDGAAGASGTKFPPVPSSQYHGLINSWNIYQTIRNIELYDSAGIGVNTDGFNYFNNAQPHYTIVEGMYIHHIASTGIVFVDAQYNIARNNEVAFTNLDWVDLKTDFYGNGILSGRGYPAFNLIENNYVHDDWGEGIGCYFGSHCVVRGNRTAQHRSAGKYISDYRDVVVEQNIFAGGNVNNEGCGWGRCANNTDGFSQATSGVELYRSLESVGNARQLFRNNLISGSSYGISISNGNTQPATNNSVLDGWFVGNTVIIEPNEVWLDYSFTTSGQVGPLGITVANNLFAGGNSTTNCTLFNGGGAGNTIAPPDYNFLRYAFQPNCTGGTHNVISSNVGLVNSFDFSDTSASNFPDWDDFAISENSDAANAGIPLTTSVLNPSDFQWFVDNFSWKPECASSFVMASDWFKILATDYCNKTRSDTPSMGAIEPSTFTPPPPPEAQCEVAAIGSAAQNDGGSSLSIPLPSGSLDGKLLLVAVATRTFNEGAFAPPAGWTSVGSPGALGIRVYAKIGTASESAPSFQFFSGAQAGFMTALNSSTGWTSVPGVVVAEAVNTAGSISTQRYEALTSSGANDCGVQFAVKQTTSTGASGVQVTSGYSALGSAIRTTSNDGLVVSGQLNNTLGQNLSQNDVSIIGNTDNNINRRISLFIRPL